MRLGTGLFADYVGHRLARGLGLVGVVWDDAAGRWSSPTTTRWPAGTRTSPTGLLGSVVGFPLTSDDEVVGVLGLATGTRA